MHVIKREIYVLIITFMYAKIKKIERERERERKREIGQYFHGFNWKKDNNYTQFRKYVLSSN